MDAELNRVAEAIERGNFIAWQNQRMRLGAYEEITWAHYVKAMKGSPGVEVLLLQLNEGPPISGIV